MNIQWQWQKFADLSNQQLYDLLKLRVNVFVVEQACPYPEVDDKDQASWHLLGCDDDGNLAAYCRVFIDKGRSVIGRIVTSSDHRGLGLGKAIMQQSMQFIRSHGEIFPAEMYLMAQHHLEPFYQSFGFITDSEPFDEDGIPHVDMVLPAVEPQ